MAINPSDQFLGALAAGNMQQMANKFPLEGIKEFKQDDKGRFELILDREYTGSVVYGNPEDKATAKLLNKVSVRVLKTITGQISKGSFQVDGESFKATKPGTFADTTLTLKRVELNEHDDKVKAFGKVKIGILPEIEGSQDLSFEKFICSNIEWKA